MPDKDTVFESDSTADNSTASTGTTDNNSHELVGEGKKYKTMEDALGSIAPAQEHIKTLEAELAELRASATKGKTMEDVLAKIEEKTSGDNTQTSTETADIDGKVEEAMRRLNMESKAKANISQVDANLREMFGDKTSEVFQSTIADLGLSKEQAMSLAQSSPNAFMKLFSTKEVVQSASPTTGGHKVQAPAETTSNGMEVLKTDKAAFLSAEHQLKMYREAMSDPDKFFATST